VLRQIDERYQGKGGELRPLAPIESMDTITLTYDGQNAAFASRERFWLAAHIEALPDGHPTMRLIAYMALFARDVLTGELPGPYSDHRARTFARLALVEPGAYQAHRRRSDRELADVLGLPVAEIPAVRRDQAAVRRPSAIRQRRQALE
jgi:hypothetical protein